MSKQYKISIDQETITRSIRRDSSHCMIADALAQAMPDARQIVVDLQSIRWSDPRKGKRYICLTPRIAQEMLIRFDNGDEAIEPFSFSMRAAQIMPIRSRVRAGLSASTTKPKVKTDGLGHVTTEGGQAPPVGPIPGVPNQSSRARLGKRRTFGLRGLRQELSE